MRPARFTAYKLAAAKKEATSQLEPCALVTLSVPFDDASSIEFNDYLCGNFPSSHYREWFLHKVRASHIPLSSGSSDIRVECIELIDIDRAYDAVDERQERVFIDTAYSLRYPDSFSYRTGTVVPLQQGCGESTLLHGHRIFFYLSRHAALFAPKPTWFRSMNSTRFPKPFQNSATVGIRVGDDGMLEKIPVYVLGSWGRIRNDYEHCKLARKLDKAINDAKYQAPYRTILHGIYAAANPTWRAVVPRAPSTRARRVPKRLIY